jgi:hypothetical protein
MTELPQQETEPGSTRPFYAGHSRTESYVAEALHSLGEVLLDTSAPTSRVQSSSAAIRQDGDSNFATTIPSDRMFGVTVSHAVLPGDDDGS